MDIRILNKTDYPETLRNAKGMPAKLYIRGSLPPAHYKYLCVIGSRKFSSYGIDAAAQLIKGLAGYPICVVSGLAIGIDGKAHEAAISAKLPTISFPGSGLDWNVLYPPCHRSLGEHILVSGGALLSRWEPSFNNTDRWVFPVRNELMAGISHATLIIEGRQGSGTMITAKSALDFGRDVLVVPGSIFSELSATPLSLMKEGAKPVTSSEDILEALGFILPEKEPGDLFGALDSPALSEEERKIVNRVRSPVSRDDLIRELALPPGYVNSVLIELEMKGLVVERQGCLTVK